MFKIFVFIFLYGAEYLIPNNIVWIICIWTHNQATGLMFQATKPSTAMSVAHSVDYLTVLEVTTLWTSYQMHQTDLFGQQYCTCRPVDTCYQVATILRTWYQMDQTESVWTTTFHLQSRGHALPSMVIKERCYVVLSGYTLTMTMTILELYIHFTNYS